MSKKVFALVVLISVLALGSLSAHAAKGSIFIDGVKLEGASPVLISGRNMVPMRVIFEKIGASVKWDGEAKAVTAVKDGKTVVLTVGSTSATIDGATSAIDSPPAIIDGKVYVPLRFSAAAFDGSVKYDNASGNVNISMSVSAPSETVTQPETPTIAPPTGSGPIVYITETGDKYHIGSCRHLSGSKIEITKDDAIKQGYKPCGICKP